MELVFEEEDTPIVITKYEITSILRVRTTQLRNGATSTLPPEDIEHIFDEQKIAEMEVAKGVCPVGVRKRVRGGRYETIYIRGGEIIVTG